MNKAYRWAPVLRYGCGQLCAQSCCNGFPIAASQPNSDFSNWTAPKLPFATSHYRPQAEIRPRQIADRQRAGPFGNLPSSQIKPLGHSRRWAFGQTRAAMCQSPAVKRRLPRKRIAAAPENPPATSASANDALHWHRRKLPPTLHAVVRRILRQRDGPFTFP